jgi:hypothetical protein
MDGNLALHRVNLDSQRIVRLLNLFEKQSALVQGNDTGTCSD